jgi:hypothetical protein
MGALPRTRVKPENHLRVSGTVERAAGTVTGRPRLGTRKADAGNRLAPLRAAHRLRRRVVYLIGGKTTEELDALRAQLKGTIVLSQPPMTNFVRTNRPEPSDPAYAPAPPAEVAGRGAPLRSGAPAALARSKANAVTRISGDSLFRRRIRRR